MELYVDGTLLAAQPGGLAAERAWSGAFFPPPLPPGWHAVTVLARAVGSAGEAPPPHGEAAVSVLTRTPPR